MRARAMVRMCCVCRRVERHGQWGALALPVPDAVVTHGYCPECFVEAMAMIETVIAEHGASNSRNRQAADALSLAGGATFAGQWQPCA